MEFKIIAEGHPNIKATHRSTFEITKDDYLTPRGDCIIGIKAEIGIAEIPEEIKGLLSLPNDVEIILKLPEYGLSEIVKAKGNEKLSFTHPTDIVVRKSNYVCGRTLAVKANKAACDLSREFVEFLKDKAELHFIIKINSTYSQANRLPP